METLTENPVGVLGIEFIEFSSPNPAALDRLCTGFGFRRYSQIPNRAISLYRQNDIRWIVNTEAGSFASSFSRSHGPCIPSMGWRVRNAKEALRVALERGARECDTVDYFSTDGDPVPAVYGIGDSLIYFIEGCDHDEIYRKLGFEVLFPDSTARPTPYFVTVDHLTNNVPKGTMDHWVWFYKHIFGFTEVRHFDIRGKKTGLQSYALRSPDGSFCIPINEAEEEKSQINEFIREYGGAGIQHIALLTEDIVHSLTELKKSSIALLRVEPDYYSHVFERVPNVDENRKMIEELGILIDGDEKGYLLQIFTRNLLGPVFFEIIQRKNHKSFGEGNFGALFRSIEDEQEKSGKL